MNEWNATNNSYYFVKVMNALDALYLGDCGPFWQDKDGAYAYDDIAFYATELTQDQIELIMDIKRGTLSEEDEIVVARGQLEAAKTDLEDYVSALGDTFATLASDVIDWLMGENDGIGSADDYQTKEDIAAAIAKIQQKQSEVQVIVMAYEAAMQKINYNKEYCDNTDYAGASTFRTALTTATNAIANPTSTDAIAAALAALEKEKVAYVFTQTGDVIDVTRVINDPWFVEEEYEPTVDGEGALTFPEGAAEHLSKDDWTMSRSESLSGATDLTLYYTNDVEKRTTANLFHSSTVAGGVLDIQQTLTGLPVGYYAVSADMSSTSDATNNHVYATSGGVTKVSPVFSLAGSGWTAWETLTTDKVLVGEDGTLTIGATSGAQYKGWFCVTNFQLKYYGTTYDMSTDLADKKSEVEKAIATLTLKGDQTAAKAKFDAIVGGEASDYDKVSQLTVLMDEVKDVAAQEQAFTALDDMDALRQANLEDEVLSSVYNNGAVAISLALEADDASVELFPSLNELYAAFVSYATTIKAAQAWPAAEVTDKVSDYVDAVSGANAEKVAEKQAELVALMKSTISGMEASEEDPKDITGLIGNASFDADQYAAWTRTIDGGTTDVAQGEVEFYNNNTFNLSQVITDIPKGVYKLVASGFYRDGNDYATIVANYNTKATDDSGEEPVELEESIYDTHANVILYAQSATFNCGTKLVSIASESVSYGAEEDDTYLDIGAVMFNFYAVYTEEALKLLLKLPRPDRILGLLLHIYASDHHSLL